MDLEISSHEKNCIPQKVKYQKIRPTRGVKGFVVNIHDTTNFDIDLCFDSVDSVEVAQKYSQVVSNEYEYYVVNTFEDTKETKGTNGTKDPIIKTGRAYRCRLRGLGVNRCSIGGKVRRNNKFMYIIRNFIDSSDGWITCTISDIDVYQRLLVDMYVNLPDGNLINIADYLLETDQEGLYYQYDHKNRDSM